MNRPRSAALAAYLLVLALSACGRADAPNASAAVDPMAVPRTADVFERGLDPAAFPRVQELGPDVYSFEYLRPAASGGTTNSLFVVTSEGVLVADGQGNPDQVRELLDAIAAVTDQPVTHVVVASDHGDHTGGNSAFPDGTTFIAHPTSATLLRASAEAPDREPGALPVPLATMFVGDQEVLHLGGKEIQILHLGRAHTGGDLMVYLPAEKVLFMSEVYFYRLFPSMRSAYPSEWLGVIEAARAMEVDVYVPGHGFVESPAILEAELESYRRAMQAVIAEVTRLHAAGLSVEEALEQADFGEYESWAGRETQVPRALPRIYMELEGTLPRP